MASVEEAFTAMQGRGAKAISEPRSAGDVRYAFFEDPNGVRVELVHQPR